MLSPSDTAIVFLLALLLFGPDQLPRIARQLGEAMRHVQSTTHSFMNEMERAARSDEPKPAPTIEPALPASPDVATTEDGEPTAAPEEETKPD
jgi:TatA/E family protein of Tat protein translocase